MSLIARLKKKGVNRAGKLKRAALPKEAPQRAKRELQQNTRQSQITALPKGSPSKKRRAVQQKTCKCKHLAAMSPEQLTAHKSLRQVTNSLQKKLYRKKCAILDAMYPQQKFKYTRDWMRLKKKLAEMSPEERTKCISEY